MARYLVTIDQFAAFVTDCYRDREWQLPPGFAEETPHDAPPEHQGRRGNYPADSVSWYNARAFCHWLGARLNIDIRLPTEAEWQIAATSGDPARVFPWGPDWDPAQEQWLANTFLITHEPQPWSRSQVPVKSAIQVRHACSLRASATRASDLERGCGQVMVLLQKPQHTDF